MGYLCPFRDWNTYTWSYYSCLFSKWNACLLKTGKTVFFKHTTAHSQLSSIKPQLQHYSGEYKGSFYAICDPHYPVHVGPPSVCHVWDKCTVGEGSALSVRIDQNCTSDRQITYSMCMQKAFITQQIHNSDISTHKTSRDWVIGAAGLFPTSGKQHQDSGFHWVTQKDLNTKRPSVCPTTSHYKQLSICIWIQYLYRLISLSPFKAIPNILWHCRKCNYGLIIVSLFSTFCFFFFLNPALISTQQFLEVFHASTKLKNRFSKD